MDPNSCIIVRSVHSMTGSSCKRDLPLLLYGRDVGPPGTRTTQMTIRHHSTAVLRCLERGTHAVGRRAPTSRQNLVIHAFLRSLKRNLQSPARKLHELQVSRSRKRHRAAVREVAVAARTMTFPEPLPNRGIGSRASCGILVPEQREHSAAMNFIAISPYWAHRDSIT